MNMFMIMCVEWCLPPSQICPNQAGLFNGGLEDSMVGLVGKALVHPI